MTIPAGSVAFRTHLVAATETIQPVALRIIDAVHDGGPDSGRLFLDALAEAQQVGGRYWASQLVMVLAALVPQDQSLNALTAWIRDAEAA